MKISKFRLLPSFVAIALFAVVTQWTMTQTLSAQTEVVEEVDVEAEAAPADDDKSLIDMYKAGGWAMYPLTLLSVAGFGLIVYNFMAVKPGPILQAEVVPQIEEALKALDISKAKTICDENPAPTTNIISAGLARVDVNHYNAEQVKEAVEEASAEELADPFVLINYLSVIGSLSPMVGLLGTVSGMVKAFNVIEAEGAGSAQALAGNISEALITTASGMIVGIPAMFFFFFFKNKYGKITSRVGRIVGDLQFTINTAITKR
ncbi:MULTISPECIES: MotA/TolQ/ExbB proton channel family protein [unclassified Lentimonas]|uniref:MotA/TolQ/ExbB proton channel family protein n=1 Tax=unclassified Lentimonas TaxID=2630993 RepID=UPI00132B1E08|nr:MULTISPECIES: MotA/TolQ/ExbB proton channel family protein [unclassified Lentimonas]CAA6680143.1 MotA/TolQ/ExbB proton channel family protein [Lentimonas sp. CC4]CAA6685590.1 MotA/TolQ/ExbB proton channel family protein [Lentimonas sp. CC6]CAA6689666.1 MotA/TolQ/ExbB proton channel family protein [Lentimonas sp. CC19]CAA6692687.1 MotA/TolQ/ExbB proton channel family protein [Lentimonas sp. CC10]CAA7069255.1 MotA/TolQ/ExbB proton channel family protein [Lentimonas sp. CC11]